MRNQSPSDSFNRKIDYLRLSVTDQCNLRCAYCLPENYHSWTSGDERLSDDEIIRLLSCFASLGFSKIRVTGGEPLVRQGIADLIGRISGIEGVTDISMSTNGMLLSRLATDLKKAGLKRINISMDSLDPEKFRSITRLGNFDQLIAGIESALRSDLSPLKINVVVARGMNENEIGDFVRLTVSKPIIVRFIELMPMGETGFFSKERLVPLQEMLEKAAPLEPLHFDDWPTGHGPARYYRRPGAKGTVGFISALSCGFCSSCNRMRLTTKGILVPCLDASEGTDLRAPLRGGAGDDEIKRLILDTVARKPERHFMVEKSESLTANPRMMCQIGG